MQQEMNIECNTRVNRLKRWRFWGRERTFYLKSKSFVCILSVDIVNEDGTTSDPYLGINFTGVDWEHHLNHFPAKFCEPNRESRSSSLFITLAKRVICRSHPPTKSMNRWWSRLVRTWNGELEVDAFLLPFSSSVQVDAHNRSSNYNQPADGRLAGFYHWQLTNF